MRRAMVAAVPVLILLLYPLEARAQESGERSDAIVDTVATASTGALERETFYYPGGQRRDPFEPLSAGDELGPRFEDLNLSGIVYSPTTGSIAVLTDRATGKRYRVWEGDLIGGAKLVRVRASEVDFVVSAFGVSRQETLRLKSQEKEQGG
ncbi:MAG: hypothetical protein P8049_05105 [Gemmatimonadota bacterium]|jgi:hypothetical protein